MRNDLSPWCRQMPDSPLPFLQYLIEWLWTHICMFDSSQEIRLNLEFLFWIEVVDHKNFKFFCNLYGCFSVLTSTSKILTLKNLLQSYNLSRSLCCKFYTLWYAGNYVIFSTTLKDELHSCEWQISCLDIQQKLH